MSSSQANPTDLVENWVTETFIDFERAELTAQGQTYSQLPAFLSRYDEEKLRNYGLKGGPATPLVKDAKALKD